MLQWKKNKKNKEKKLKKYFTKEIEVFYFRDTGFGVRSLGVSFFRIKMTF